MSLCKEGEYWSIHNIEGYLDKKVRNKMRKNGRFNFLVIHNDKNFHYESLLASDLQHTVQKAINIGCDTETVIQKLDLMKDSVEGGGVLPMMETGNSMTIYQDSSIEPGFGEGWGLCQGLCHLENLETDIFLIP
jgi:hypothetical protein